ncbi:TolC family protein [Sphingobium fluviale]|uniref:TolC family protein n=1 Tax=Sphingobium fluviale TaxID=2506423 RepID=A0A4V1N353_9SPHN|nr:TolC family protein [Sphingobium fluviale]RXR25192.1 TolC family protein [Sphingobium fluviale]
MFIRLRTALLAGTLISIGAPAAAEPISLGEALSQGRAASPRITRAEAEVKAAEGRALQAGVSPNPELGLEVENFSGTGPYRNFRQTETTLAVSQEFELGGKRRARKAVAAAELDFFRLALVREVAALDYDIRIAHADLAASEARGALARETLDRARELSRVAKELVDAGRDPPLRQLRADALLAEAEAELARAAGEYVSARRKLALLTGSSDPELTAAPGNDEQPPTLPADTPSLDERLATAEREAAQARVSLAQAEAVPNVTASGGVRRFREGGETAIVAGISIPLPFRNRNQGNIAAARAETDAASAVLAQTRLEANFNRRDAELMVSAANERVAALSGPGLAQAEEAARLANIGYRAGKFALIELIDAQEALNSARRNLIEAQLDRARALAALARANAQ